MISPGRYAAEFIRRAVSESNLDVSERKPNDELPEDGDYRTWYSYARLDIDRYQESIGNVIISQNLVYKSGTRMLISVHGPISPVTRLDDRLPPGEIEGTWGCLTMWVDESGAILGTRTTEGEDEITETADNTEPYVSEEEYLAELIETRDNSNPYASEEDYLAEFIEMAVSKYNVNVSALEKKELPPGDHYEMFTGLVCLSKDKYKVSIEALCRAVSIYTRHTRIFAALSNTFVDPNHWYTFSYLTLWIGRAGRIMPDPKSARETFMMNELTREMIEAKST